MFDQLSQIQNIFTKICNYSYLNTHNTTKLRDSKTPIKDIFIYKFSYSQIEVTQQQIISKIYMKNNNNSKYKFSYTNKENNIDLTIYENILSEIFLKKNYCPCGQKYKKHVTRY